MAYKKTASSQNELVDDAEEFSDSTPSLPFAIHIVSVLPDPDGKDENSEQIILQLDSGNAVDLDGLFVHVGTKKSMLADVVMNS